jgi:hypothetical protein
MTELYKPKGSYTLDKILSIPQIRLGIQGYGGTGKTWSSLTFPNPVVLNLDRGLGAHLGRADVTEIPFYKPEFSGSGMEELKDKIIEWLSTEGKRLTPEQTLVFDGCTSLQAAYHMWYRANRHLFLTKQGKEDDFAQWRVKVEFYGEIMAIFKSLQCHVIFIAHEADKKDKDGSYSGKIRPLLTGQFNDELVSHFTDFFRQLTNDKPSADTEISQESLAKWGMKTRVEFDAMCATFPRNTIYYWQTCSDSVFDGKCSSLVEYPMYMPANYNSFLKYQRKI